MNKKYTIGIDIGGTNTDAVLIDSTQKIIASCKTATTKNISEGFLTALQTVVANGKISPQQIRAVLVGTTHATNALLEQKELCTVGVIRIAGHKPDTLPPCFAWPEDIRNSIFAGYRTVDGGFDCNGKVITQFKKEQIQKAVEELIKLGAQSIAIVGIFSPINSQQELLACQIIKELVGSTIPVTMSHSIGGVGFIERENSTILNCALQKSLLRGFTSLETTVKSLNISAPVYITQNNGTIIDLTRALEYPVLTISAGPTNSFIGGIKLAGVSDGIVADIGGTSTDMGIVCNGFARRSINSSSIAGISLNFSMPDVVSIALGGGSYITQNPDGSFKIGPQSSARLVFQESRSFGGQKLTLTDAALAGNIITLAGADPSKTGLTSSDISCIMNKINSKLTNLANFLRGPNKELPLILVGGGAHLLPKNLLANCIIPEHASVANAYGAALAEISGTVDTVVSLTNRQSTLDSLRDKALQQAVNQGADPKTVRIVDQQIIPYHYVPDNLARIIITAAGNRL